MDLSVFTMPDAARSAVLGIVFLLLIYRTRRPGRADDLMARRGGTA